jgi:hypothetical protein
VQTASGAVALLTANFVPAINYFEEDDSNALSMCSLITTYEKNGQDGNARRISASSPR